VTAPASRRRWIGRDSMPDSPRDDAVRLVEAVLMQALYDRGAGKDDAPTVTDMAKQVVEAMQKAGWHYA
jgi:hypothetical protein